MDMHERMASQPSDLSYAPPAYPRHDYTGTGLVVRVAIGAEVVGYLTRKGDSVCWNASAPPDTDAGIVRRIVADHLAQGAAEGRPLDEVWSELLRMVPHTGAREAPLSEFVGT